MSMHQSLQENRHIEPFYLETNYVFASRFKRLANYVIDLAIFSGFLYFTGILYLLQSADAPDNIEISPGLDILDVFTIITLYIIFMFIQETFLKGKSIGKFITGTRAVTLDEKRITVYAALKRSIIRAIPFCAFSAFSSPCAPWQDVWTSTKVIDERIRLK